MDLLNQMVETLTKEEVRLLKIYFSRFNSGDDRKDIALLDYMRKSREKYNEDKIYAKLYGGNDRNSFYRLRNRLVTAIGRSLTSQYFDVDDANNILYLIALSKLYFNRNNYQLSFFFLKKAETKATKMGLFELLDVIYSDYIKLSHEIVSINPEIYIDKRKENDKQLNQSRQIDDILAVVSYRLKVNQNFSSTKNPIIQLLQDTVEDFSMDKEISNSPFFRFKIYQAVSQVLLQRREYKSLEEYLLKTFKEFTKENLFNKSNHNTKLQMLTYIVNTLFANNKLELSLKYANVLKESMDEYNKLLYDKYVFFYFNALVLNYYVTDIDKGIILLEELKSNESLKNTPFYEVFVYLNLAIFWFKKKDYHKSIKQLNKLFQHDSYQNADRALQFKIAIAELIIRYELNDYDFLEYRTKQIGKDYKDLLKSEENQREKEFISILKEMLPVETIKSDKRLYARVSSFISSDKLESGTDDAEVINYTNWLKSKI